MSEIVDPVADGPDATGAYGSGWSTSGRERGIGVFMARLGTARPRPRVVTVLRDVYGRSARDRARPDTARAAAALGVSRRTVQRWVTQDRLPAPGRSVPADRVRRAWADSPAGRARRIPPATKEKLTAGVPVGGRVQAKVWVSSDSRNGMERAFAFNLSGPEAAAFYQALAAGRDEAAYDIFHGAVARGFGGSVDIHLNNISLGP